MSNKFLEMITTTNSIKIFDLYYSFKMICFICFKENCKSKDCEKIDPMRVDKCYKCGSELQLPIAFRFVRCTTCNYQLHIYDYIEQLGKLQQDKAKL